MVVRIQGLSLFDAPSSGWIDRVGQIPANLCKTRRPFAAPMANSLRKDGDHKELVDMH